MKNFADKKEEQIAEHLEAVMELLEIEKTESNEDTPYRIAKMWNREVFANRNKKNMAELDSSMFVTDNTEEYGGRLLVVKDIPFNSMCEHHFMPFSGKVSVGYAPKDKIIGLSKIPRIVEYFSKMPQLQERMTVSITKYIDNLLEPYFTIVSIEASHSCVSCRGVELPCSTRTRYHLYDNHLDLEDLSYYIDDFHNQVKEG